jgi:hypothetical protein
MPGHHKRLTRATGQELKKPAYHGGIKSISFRYVSRPATHVGKWPKGKASAFVGSQVIILAVLNEIFPLKCVLALRKIMLRRNEGL